MACGSRRFWAWVGTLGVILWGCQPGMAAQANPKNITKQVQNQVDVDLPSLSPIVERVMAAVVNVSVIMDANGASPIADDVPDLPPDAAPGSGDSSLDELLRRYLEQNGRSPLGNGLGDGPQQPGTEMMALGSGFVIDPTGYIVTNNHVVANADRITVILQDNSRHPAKLVGRDPKTDLAVLKIDAPHPLPFVEWGDSDAAKVGDWVVAVGNPFGLGGTVTAGIVSARGRDIDDGPYDDFLQIDAPINRGNSGGPTFNLHGEVIGINTAIYTPSGGSVGIGFAIPSDFARNIVDQLRSTGHVERGWLGVSIQTLTPSLAKVFGESPDNPQGALIDGVTPGGPAAKAGLQRGDVITAADGTAIRSAHDLPRIVADSKIGRKLDLTVQRGDRTEKMAATIAPLPSTAQLAALTGAEQKPVNSQPQAVQVGPLGMQLAPLSPDLRSELHATQHTKGVVVEGLVSGGPAAALGIQPGDIIESVNRQTVDTPHDAESKIQQALGGGDIVLFVDRNGSGQYVGLATD